ncbi:MAG: hypothetical protein RSG92_15365 [Pseudomonas sp.]
MLAPDPQSVAAEFSARAAALRRLRLNPSALPALRAYYADHPAAFISDWGITIDPRLPEKGLPSMVPFRLFPRQVELVEWILDRYSRSENGALPKSRDVGASWVTMALACTLCLFRDGLHIGFGSRKAEYVDALGSPKALFPRARLFLQHLPREFLGGWQPSDFPHMRCNFPGTGSAITGEAGDNIGRGDRASIYFVDEAAFLERPQLIEASLSATTNCRIDLSSANGTDNPFYDKVSTYPAERVFYFHWRDHPYRDDAWYAKQVADLPAVVVAQEIDLSFTASKEGIIIPPEWVQSAIGAATKLGIEPRGERRVALDVADQGVDINAVAGFHGIELQLLHGWSGKEDDIAGTTAWTFKHCDDFGATSFDYDSDGLGVGVRGDARLLNEQRAGRPINARPWRAGAAVHNPDGPIETLDPRPKDKQQRTNKDTFKNAKAQAWHSLRLKFERTHRAVTGGEQFDPDLLISINPALPGLGKLTAELSQPTWAPNSSGLLVVDKSPDGTKSPNFADAVMMARAPAKRGKRSFFTR